MPDTRTLDQLHADCEKACAILQKTNDGGDLDPGHLYLVQSAVNGILTEKGKQAFEDLCRQVEAGYKKPWFHGIEHMTRDHEGYIYWKGKHVEHYSFYGPKAWEEEGKEAQELARRCRHLESIGVEVNYSHAVWTWEKYADLKSTDSSPV